jgi:hypothetical protein
MPQGDGLVVTSPARDLRWASGSTVMGFGTEQSAAELELTAELAHQQLPHGGEVLRFMLAVAMEKRRRDESECDTGHALKGGLL